MNAIQVAVLLGSSAVMSAAFAELPELPHYNAESCCQLCPAAADNNNYQGSFLQSNYQIIEGQNGWLFRSQSDLKTDFVPNDDGLAMLSAFRKKLESRGSQVVLVYTPSRGLMHAAQLNGWPFEYARALANYQKTLQAFRHAGFIVPPLDQLTTLANNQADSYFFHRDIHWTPWGAQKTAELVASTVKSLPLYQQIPDKAFTTQLNGVMTQTGAMQAAVSHLCSGERFPSEYRQQYQTDAVTPAATSNTDSASSVLSSSKGLGDVVLLGSSFSALSRFNFDGFLKQALGKDVTNMALSGGDNRGAWAEYLSSDAYQQHPPRLIVWEVPAQYNMSDKSLLRQLIPLVDNGCQSKKVLMQQSQALNQGTGTDLVFNRSLIGTRASDLVMDMTISDPTVHNVQVRIWYQDGTHDEFLVKQNKRAQTGGRFVFLLARDASRRERNYLSMDITGVDSKQPTLTMNTSVCRQEADALQTARL